MIRSLVLTILTLGYVSSAEAEHHIDTLEHESQSGLAASAAAACRSPDGRILGFTPLPQSYLTRHVFVSNSGSDNNSGLSPWAPKQTLAAGIALLREGFPDMLLLKRGDTFSVGTGLSWQKSGKDALNRMVVTGYDAGPRPKITNTPNSTGSLYPALMLNSSPSRRISHVIFTGLEFAPASYEPNTPASQPGVVLLGENYDIILENLEIHHFSDGMVVQGFENRSARDIQVRRNIIHDNYPPPNPGAPHSQGIFADYVVNLKIIENVFLQNGHQLALRNATIFNHNMYLQWNNRAVEVIGNISALASSHGLQLRPHGVVQNNLFLDNAINLLAGSAGNPDPAYAAQISSTIKDNVIIGSRNILGTRWDSSIGQPMNSTSPGGFAIDVIGGGLNRQGGHHISGNIISKRGNSSMDYGISLKSFSTYPLAEATLLNNKAYNWGNNLTFEQPGAPMNLTVERNEFHETRTGSAVVAMLSTSTGNFPSFTSSGNNRMSCGALRSGQSCVNASTWGVSTLMAFFARIFDVGSVEAPHQFADPERDAGSYFNQISNSNRGLDGFYRALRNQGKTTWDCSLMAEQVNNYIRAGFALVDPSITGIRR